MSCTASTSSSSAPVPSEPDDPADAALSVTAPVATGVAVSDIQPSVGCEVPSAAVADGTDVKKSMDGDDATTSAAAADAAKTMAEASDCSAESLRLYYDACAEVRFPHHSITAQTRSAACALHCLSSLICVTLDLLCFASACALH